MEYKILKDGEAVNTIVADEAFVAKYCSKNGYTYEQLPDPAPAPVPEPVPSPDTNKSVWDELDAAYQEGVNSAYENQ